jgi:hypothetical protein
MTSILCPYCFNPGELTTGERATPRHKHLWSRQFLACFPCGAFVATSKRGKPLGRMAKGPVRYARAKAHEAFDALWQDPKRAGFRVCNHADFWTGQQLMRRSCYLWLADVLQMSVDEAHFGLMMDVPLLEAIREMALQADPADIRRRYPIVRTVMSSKRRRAA